MFKVKCVPVSVFLRVFLGYEIPVPVPVVKSIGGISVILGAKNGGYRYHV